jgi:putative (di)nucleoside polyphosphate hydrolase
VKKSDATALYTAMSDYIDGQGFRANVGIVLMRNGGDVLLGGRCDGRGWQFPQGGMRRGESAEDALYRELHEEVGLESKDVDMLAATEDWLRYRLPRQYVRRASRPRCIGQKQRWFLLKFLGEDRQLPLRHDRRARIRQLALGGLLDPGPRGDLFQARRLRPGARELGVAAFPAAATATGLVAGTGGKMADNGLNSAETTLT